MRFKQPLFCILKPADSPRVSGYKKIAEEGFSSGETAFPGDDDNGTMAAWYVFSGMGFYPVCPGKDEYIVGIPFFEEVEITGKKLPCLSDKTAVTTKDLAES